MNNFFQKILALGVLLYLTSCISLKDIQLIQPDEKLKLDSKGMIEYNMPEYYIQKDDMVMINISTVSQNGMGILSDFISNGNNYTKIVFEPDTGLTFISGTSNTTVYSILDNEGSWVDEAYRTISITGGADVTNSTAITNLKTLALQVVEDEETDTHTLFVADSDGRIR